MRTTWILVGIGGLSSVALGTPTLQFATAINQGDALAGNPNGDSYGGSPTELVVAPNGDIGLVGETANTSDSTLVLLKNSGSTWNNSDIATGNNSVSVNFASSSSSKTLTEFDNLAATGPAEQTRLTFATLNNSTNAGLLQYDAPTPSNSTGLSSIAFQGTSGVSFGTADSLTGPIEFQVNGAGNALLVANNGTKLIEGSAGATSTVFNNGSTVLTSGSATRLALAPNGSGAAVLGPTTGFADSGKKVYDIPTQQNLSASLVPVVPEAVLGYANAAGANTALILANGTGSTQQVDYSSSNTAFAPQPLLTFTPPADRFGATPLRADVAPNGQVAMYVPAETGGGAEADHLVYANLGATSPAASVQSIATIGQSVIDPSSPGLSIQRLYTDTSASAPWINQAGITVFNAIIGTSSANEQQALLEWAPGATSPTVLLMVGDQLEIGHNPTSADLATITSIDTVNGNIDDSYFRNTLNDNGEIAVAVDYQYVSNGAPGSAVLVAQLPEPATLAMLPAASLMLLRRHRSRVRRQG